MIRLSATFLRPYKLKLVLLTAGMGLVAFLEAAVIGVVYPLAGMLSGGDGVESSGVILSQMQLVVEWVPIDDRVLASVLLLGVLAVMSFALATGIDLMLLRFRYRLLEEYVTQIFSRILGYRLAYFQRGRGGELADHVMNTSESVGEVLVVLPRVGLSLARIVVTTILLVSVSLSLTIVVYIVVGGLGLLMRRIGQRVAEVFAPRLEAERTKLITLCTELAGGIRQIKAFGAENVWRGYVAGSAGRFADESVKVNFGGMIVSHAGRMLVVLIVCGIVGYGRVFPSGASSEMLPVLAVYLAALTQLIPAVAELGANWVSMQALKPRLKAAHEILNNKVNCENMGAGSKVELIRELVMDKVSFGYGCGLALDEVSLEIRRGENVAVVGESGAGKSTLIDVLLRLHEPDTGEIRIDGVDYRQIELACWRGQTAMVSQDPVLFHDTVAANIRMGNPDANMEEVREAARVAQAESFIQELPREYEAMVGERGESLSGGQRQRLAIARALIRRPSLLILDEATSALDSVTMREMESLMSGLYPEMACVFVTHRLQSARAADRIYVLDEGSVAGAGTHEELLTRCPAYQRLWHAHEEREQSEKRD